MYVVAIIGDLLSLIPFVNIFSGAVTGFLLWVLGSESEGTLYGDKDIALTLVTYAVEMFPVASMIPAWTIRVYFAKKAAKDRNRAAGSS